MSGRKVRWYRKLLRNRWRKNKANLDSPYIWGSFWKSIVRKLSKI